MTMQIHCSTCGQDLPEPQRRLAEAALNREQVLNEARALGILKSGEELAAEWRDLDRAVNDQRAAGIRRYIRERNDAHEIDEVWWLRDYEQNRRNGQRYAQFSARTRMFKFTVPMERRAAAPDQDVGDCPIVWGPVVTMVDGAAISDGALGTFHHPVQR